MPYLMTETFIQCRWHDIRHGKWHEDKKMDLQSVGLTIGGGFFAGALIGFALKKVLKLVAVVVGLFLAGIAYLQYQQILQVNWPKLQMASQNSLSTLASAATQIPGISSNDHSIALSNLVPLTGSMSAGLVLGFLKG
jgi:uncharacterized membrane protein (Fun14 family)